MTYEELATTREARVVRTFVELADTLTADFDVIDMLTTLAARSVELLDAAAAGILLADDTGLLRVMAASSDAVELLELLQIQNEEGPCTDCYRFGTIVDTSDLAAETRWPSFAPESLAAGFSAVCAVPVRLRADVIGCLNLFMSEPRPLAAADVQLAQALSDMACIAVFQHRAAEGSSVTQEQLQIALNSRVIIEQAKGILAERDQLTMHDAFTQLRRFARNNNRRLAEIAEGVVAGTVDIDAVTSEH